MQQPMHHTTAALMMLVGLASTVATGQVAPPPPANPEVQPEYVPPPRPQPAARPQGRPAQPARPSTAQRIDSLPTHLPYPKLAQKGEDERIIRLKDLPDIVALRANPTVGPGSVEAIMPVIYGRRARFEMLAIENLDLLWKLRDGAIENLDMTDLAALSGVAEMIKPLVGRTTLSEELTNRGILSRMQGGMNDHIVREYKQAISEEIQAREGMDGMMEFMRFILEDSIHEADIAYYGLMAELRVNGAAVLEELGIENTALEAEFGTFSDDPQERDRQVEAMHEAIKTLSVDDAIRVLTALRENRANPNMSPTVMTIDVMHPAKRVDTVDDVGVEVRSRNTGAKRPAEAGDE